MKILAVSDRVVDHLYHSEVKRQYPDVGLIIGCGDLPYYYLDFLVSAFDVPLVYVRGNHDGGAQYTADGRTLSEVMGGVDLHGRIITRKDIILAGLEGSRRYRPHDPYMYTESEMRRYIARLAPRLVLNRAKYGRSLDILVTHSPPFGIHDIEDLPHTGFKIFRNFMTMFQPKYLLHGHIHIYRQDDVCVTDFEQTCVMNVYPYRLFEFGERPLR
jgi:Icc-related predicted phosphoesterase